MTTSNKKLIAIIPAKGNSVRLPNKNILNFHGKPMISWTIESALKSKLFDKIIISTDSNKIKNICKSYNVEIFKRGKQTSSNNATVVDVCLEVLNLKENLNYKKFCCLYATAPFRNQKIIKKVVNQVDLKNCHFSMAVTEFNFPFHQALITNNNFLKPVWKKKLKLDYKKIQKVLVDNGSTYCASVSKFKKIKSFYGNSLKGIEMDWTQSIDINNLKDFLISKALFNKIL